MTRDELIIQFDVFLLDFIWAKTDYDKQYYWGRLVGWLTLAVYLLPDDIYKKLHDDAYESYNSDYGIDDQEQIF